MLRRVFVTLCLCAGLAAAPASADAAPLSLKNDMVPGPGAAKKLGAGSPAQSPGAALADADPGYTLRFGPNYVDRRNYTVRLVASGLADIERIRADAQSAASGIQAASGVNLTVAAGTLATWREPLPGEIMLKVMTGTGSDGDCVAAGCAHAGAFSSNGPTITIESAAISISAHVVTNVEANQRKNIVMHEFGHAMGLDHYVPAVFNGVYQVMATYAYGVTSYQQGDRNGLAYVGRIPDVDGDGVNDWNDWCVTRVGVASNHGCQPEGQQSSSAVYRPNIDSAFMFYPKTNGLLAMAYMDPSQFFGWSLGQHPGSAPVGAPSTIHRANDDVLSFFRGTDSRIHTTWLNHSTNVWSTTGAMTGPAAGPPSAVERPNGDMHVIYKGTDGVNHDLWYNNAAQTWNDQWLGGVVAGNPHVAARANGDIHIFYRTNTGLIYDLWLSGSTWNNQYLGGAPVTDPRPLVRPDTNELHVFYKATDGALYDLWLSGSTWHNQWMGGSAAGEVAPLYSTKNGDLHAFYRSTTGYLRDLWMDSQNNQWHDDIIGGGGMMAGSASPVNRTKTGDLHVFYVATDGDLEDLVYNGYSWSPKLLSSDAVVPTS